MIGKHHMNISCFKKILIMSLVFLIFSCGGKKLILENEIKEVLKDTQKLGLIIEVKELNYIVNLSVLQSRVEKRFYPILDELKNKKQKNDALKQALINILFSQNIEIIDLSDKLEKYVDENETRGRRITNTYFYDPEKIKEEFGIDYILGIKIQSNINIKKISNRVKRVYSSVKLSFIDISSNESIKNLRFFEKTNVNRNKNIKNDIDKINTAINDAIDKNFQKIKQK